MYGAECYVTTVFSEVVSFRLGLLELIWTPGKGTRNNAAKFPRLLSPFPM